MLTYEKGDLITNKGYTIFCHQVNCRYRMGSGIAKQIRSLYPEVYREYMSLNRQTLGTIQPVITNDCRVCINMFAQDNYGRDGKRYTDYTAFKNCLNEIEKYLKSNRDDMVVAFPYGIGCGLGGGDWHVIKGMLMDFSSKIKQPVKIVSLR